MNIFGITSIISVVFIIALIVSGSVFRERSEAYRNRASLIVIGVWILTVAVAVVITATISKG
ncbi:hypothetical protein [Paenibacillus turpanensis]|uniref:hypothetical protein n=1 Tax=Paenibacillus turpanensis TaxID=2689078 RepID=UPI0014089F1F|nr:hypothetical protein [Paenibacillus turpanensis]